MSTGAWVFLSAIFLIAALIGLVWPVRRGVFTEVTFWAVALFFWWFGGGIAFAVMAAGHVIRLFRARVRARA